jgi:hypothetical protein
MFDRLAMSLVLLALACSTEKRMNEVAQQVAADAVAQYELAKRGPDKIQTCVQAGIVAAAYLQAKDESSYNAWKNKEREDCAQAGIPK